MTVLLASDKESARRWGHQLCALFALLGFAFTATTPGFSLVAMSGGFAQVNGVLGVYVCHAPGTSGSVPDQDGPRAETCCLICQMVNHLSGGQTSAEMVLALPSALVAVLAAGDAGDRMGQDRLIARARAPPVGMRVLSPSSHFTHV